MGHTASPMQVGKKQKRREELLKDLTFLSPAIILFSFIFTISLIQAIYYSFTDWYGITPDNAQFIWFGNYIRLFTRDTAFWDSLLRTFHFVIINCVGTIIIAMLFAVALVTRFPANNFYRTILFLPNMISLVVTGFVWRFLYGVVIPALCTTFTIPIIDFIGDANLVISAVAIMSIWQSMGYIMIIFIAALIGVDENLLDAARVDGATAIQTFFKVRLPLMLPVVSVGIFLNLAGSMRIFDSVLSLTAGGPGFASEVAMLNLYREAFVRLNSGYANAKSIILTLITMVMVLLQLKYTTGKDY